MPVTAMWRSARGPHRLFQWHEELGRIRKSSVTIGPLEIRLGGNGRAAQSLLPPSITDGWGRRWVVSLEECSPVPLPPAVLRRILDMFGKDGSEEVGDVDLEEVGHSIAVFHNAVSHAVSHNAQPHAVSHNAQPHAVSHLLNRDHTSNPEGHHSTTPNKSLPPAIQRAIVGTLPGSSGFRNQLLLQFARQLKGIPELATREVSQLEPYVRDWHRLALSTIGTQEFDVTWHDFTVAWGNVKYPAGEGPLDEIYAAGLSHMPAIAQRYQVRGVRNLVALCRELQQRAGDNPFWLACRPAAAVLKTSPTSANRWLWKLIHDHVIELITQGTRGRAAEYRYRGD